MTAPLSLAPRLDLPAASPLSEAIRASKGQALNLDAGNVAHLGGLCLQVLLAAAASWRAAGQTLRINPRSQAFEDAVAMFGLAPAQARIRRVKHESHHPCRR
ncbi:STAS domain-containing protein [Frigidibacter albus]